MSNTGDKLKEGIHDAGAQVKDAAHAVAEKTKDAAHECRRQGRGCGARGCRKDQGCRTQCGCEGRRRGDTPLSRRQRMLRRTSARRSRTRAGEIGLATRRRLVLELLGASVGVVTVSD